MKLSTALLTAAITGIALVAGAYEYTFSGDRNVMESFRYGRWMPKAKMDQETSFQNVDGRVMLVVAKENPAWYPKTDEVLTDGIATLKIQLVNSGNVILRVRSHYASDNHYYFQFQPSQKRVNFSKRFNNKTIPIGKPAYFDLAGDKKYELQALCKGNTFALKVNGKLIGTWTDSDKPILKGLCGFGTNWGSKFYIDSFNYQNCEVEIPAVSADKPAAKPAAPVVVLEKKK